MTRLNICAFEASEESVLSRFFSSMQTGRMMGWQCCISDAIVDRPHLRSVIHFVVLTRPPLLMKPCSYDAKYAELN